MKRCIEIPFFVRCVLRRKWDNEVAPLLRHIALPLVSDSPIFQAVFILDLGRSYIGFLSQMRCQLKSVRRRLEISISPIRLTPGHQNWSRVETSRCKACLFAPMKYGLIRGKTKSDCWARVIDQSSVCSLARGLVLGVCYRYVIRD